MGAKVDPEDAKKLDVIEPSNVSSGMANSNNDRPKHQFEDLIESLGSFGHWQRVIFVLISAADIYGSTAMLLPVFTGATPQWTCTKFQDANGTSFYSSSIRNETKFTETCDVTIDGTRYDCTQYEFDKEFTSIVTEWKLVCSMDYASGLITTIQMTGLIVGAFCFGQMSDSFGRKRPYFMSFSFLIFSGFASSFASSWQVYAFCRFLVGLGFGALMVINCVYPLEFVGRRWRTVCGTLGFWAVGQLILALMANYIRNWRHLTMALTISGVVFYITWFFIPESPRWLMEKERYEEAESILEHIAHKNNRPPPDISDLRKVMQEEKAEEERKKKYTYVHLFNTWKYCKITLIQLLAWFSTFLMYYELAFNMGALSGNRYVNMVLAGLVDLVAMLSVIPLNNTIGRRPSLVLYVASALVANAILLGIYAAGKEEESAAPTAILAFALLGKSSALAGTYVLQIFSAELYPTVVRNLGVGAGSVAGRIGGMVAPQLLYLGTLNVTVPYIVSSVLCIVMLPLVVQLPETKSKPLQDAL